MSYDSCLKENQQLKEKLFKLENDIHLKYIDEYNKQKERIISLENDLLTLKSTSNHAEDLQKTIENLQTQLQNSVSYFIGWLKFSSYHHKNSSLN